MTADYIDISSQLKPLVSCSDNPVFDSVSYSTDIVQQENQKAKQCSNYKSSEEPWRGVRLEIPASAKKAFELLRSVGPLLLIGVAVGIAISVFVSVDTVATITSMSKGFEIPVAAAIGTPIYTTTAVLVPIADSLQGVGVSVGAIVALTIAGSGANLPEFILLTRFFRVQIVIVFFVYVFLVAVSGGSLAQTLLR